MIPACTLQSIKSDLQTRKTYYQVKQIDNQRGVDVLFQMSPVSKFNQEQINTEPRQSIIGVLFARPSNEISKREILSEIEYYHHKSGDIINFYMPGYGAYWQGEYASDRQPAVTVGGTQWFFSNDLYVKFEREISNQIPWKPSGDCELLLLSVNSHEAQSDKDLKLTGCIKINITSLLADGMITSASNLINIVINSIEEDCTITLRQLSNRLASNNGQKAFFDLLGMFKISEALGRAFSRVKPYALTVL